MSGIKISPNFYQKDWQDLSLDKNSNDWDTAIEIFKDRIEGRYFKQIDVLDNNPNRKIGLFSGFVIMSITCLLIETLEQFWTGNVQSSRKKKHETDTSSDSKVFFSLFQRSDKLGAFFDTEEKANVFYTKIRCGLLHQGQTKGKSLIHIRNSEPMLKWINEKDIYEGLSINRRKFLKEIKIVYESYLTELEKPHNLNFRKKTLLKKMDYIVNQK